MKSGVLVMAHRLRQPGKRSSGISQGAIPKLANQPIRELAKPEDIAFAALFLASERSRQITGQLIGVCGGSWMP